MKLFKNIKEAHYYYKFPGSYRVGTIIKNDIVVRIYSNGFSKPDFFNKNKNKFYYVLNSNKIKEAFLNNKKNNIKVHIFAKEQQNVKYYGLYSVIGIRNNSKYVLLQR